MLNQRVDLSLGCYGWKLVMLVPSFGFPFGKVLVLRVLDRDDGDGIPHVAIASSTPSIPLYPHEKAQATAMRTGPTGFHLN